LHPETFGPKLVLALSEICDKTAIFMKKRDMGTLKTNKVLM
jgi:hypothetical protein